MDTWSVREILAFAGRHGPLLLFGGVLIGLVAPPLAEAARPLLGLAVFVFTLGAFLKVDVASFRGETTRRAWVMGVLVWTTFGVPLAMLVLVRLLEPEPMLVLGMLLCMLAPPVGSAAAIAAMLGLSAPLALLATVAATLLSPLYLPPLASGLLGYDLQIDPVDMAARLLLIVGGACLCATLLRRFAGRFVTENPHAMTGVAVLGLILVAIGAMRGMQVYFVEQPREVARMFVLAFAVNAGFQALGTLLFWPAGRLRALSVGLVSGNRNVTLVWAAAGASLVGAPEVELYLAMSVFPIFMMPALTRRIIAQLLLGAAGAPTIPPSIAANPPAS
jgi:predicted Na+-dependent transporter